MNVGINFKSVFQYLLPFRIRQSRMVEYMAALLAPLQVINGYFASHVETIRYDLKFNGQVMYLEHLLNDTFDDSLRRVYIDDPAGQQIFTPYLFNKIEMQPPLHLYNVADAKPLLDNIVLRNTPELVVTTDFVVHVPAAVFNPTIQTQMSDLIDRYRIAGKRYTFQTF